MSLDLEAVELKKHPNIIAEKKGTSIDLSTDCVSAKKKQQFKLDVANLVCYYFDKKKQVPCYKIEEKETLLNHEQLANDIRK
jgi:hypothetical protein